MPTSASSLGIWLAVALAATSPAGAAPETPVDLDTLRARLQSLYPETTRRPLFTPTRSAPVVEKPVPQAPKPIEVAAEPAKPPALKLSSYRLVGILWSDAEQIALLEHASSGVVHRLRAGRHTLVADSGAEVEVVLGDITASSITLTAERSFTLAIRRKGADGIQPVGRRPGGMEVQGPADVEVRLAEREETIAPLSPSRPSNARVFTVAARPAK